MAKKKCKKPMEIMKIKKKEIGQIAKTENYEK